MCVWVSLIFRKKNFGVERQGTPLESGQQGFPLPSGATGCLVSGQLDWGLCSPVTECSQAASWRASLASQILRLPPPPTPKLKEWNA